MKESFIGCELTSVEDNLEKGQIQLSEPARPTFDLNPLAILDFKTLRVVKQLEYLCVVISAAGCIYFLSKHYFYVALEYFQVWFISCLVILFDCEDKVIQRISLLLLVLVSCGWGTTYTIVNSSNFDENEFKIAVIITGLMAIFFLGGMVTMASVIPKISPPSILKVVELDLLLYLISLNAICFFTDNQFNNNLHMILDLRTMVMLYGGIYQERDKMKLLQIPSFQFIITLIIISFVLFAFGFKVATLVADSIYVVIGTVLFLEFQKAKERLQSRDERLSRLSSVISDLP
jgi:hypothetical protein